MENFIIPGRVRQKKNQTLRTNVLETHHSLKYLCTVVSYVMNAVYTLTCMFVGNLNTSRTHFPSSIIHCNIHIIITLFLAYNMILIYTKVRRAQKKMSSFL